MAKSRPKIILSAAMSIDGKISTITGDSKLSSKNDLRRLHKLRSRVDAILIGKKTVKVDDPILTVRYVKGKNPIRIILDPLGSISSKYRIIKTAKQIPTIFVCTNKITSKNQKSLEKNSIDVIKMGSEINLKKLLLMLSQKNIRTILLEGGGLTNWEFLRQNLIDEIHLTITPYLIGGRDSVSLIGGAGFSRISNSPKFGLKKVRRLEDELILQYTKL